MRSVGGLSATSLRECSTAERHLKVFERCVPCHGILLLYFPPTRSVTAIHHDLPSTPMRKITHQKERCTPVEPAFASQREKERERVYNNGSLSKVKEQIIGALCLGPFLQKKRSSWCCGSVALVGKGCQWPHKRSCFSLPLDPSTAFSLHVKDTHTQEWPQRSRVNQTHCAHGKRNRKHLDSQCALNVDEAALYVAALGGWQQAECGRHVFHCLPIA